MKSKKITIDGVEIPVNKLRDALAEYDGDTVFGDARIRKVATGARLYLKDKVLGWKSNFNGTVTPLNIANSHLYDIYRAIGKYLDDNAIP